jgi:lipid II:glycine glycyltransferase (peptidoglycan interpeptide bridge formation enzyme)
VAIRACQSEADYIAWDRFLFDFPGAHYFQTYGWLKSYEPMGFTPHVLAQEVDGSITGGVGFLTTRIPIPVLRWRIAVVPHGPVPAIPNDTWRNLMNALDTFCKEQRVIYAQIYPHEQSGASMLVAALESLGYNQPALLTSHRFSSTPVLVNLAGRSEEEILAGLRKKTRQYVRRALSSDLRLKTHVDDHVFGEIYRLLLANGKLLDYRVRPYASVRAAWDWYATTGQATFLQAWRGDELVGAVLLVFTGRTAYYLAGAVQHGFQEQRPAEFLHWHAIREAIDRGMDAYDLVNTSTEGVEQFKQGFRPTIHAWHAPRTKLYVPSVARTVAVAEPVLRPVLRAAARFLASRRTSGNRCRPPSPTPALVLNEQSHSTLADKLPATGVRGDQPRK